MAGFNGKKYRRYVILGLVAIDLVVILILVFVPIKFLNTTLRKEAYAKDREVKRLIDFEVFGFTK
jgi:hypothetical protein